MRERNRTTDRVPCCEDPKQSPPCRTRFRELRAWVCKHTGKGVRVLSLEGEQRGKAPFYAQPVGFDGRAFLLAKDHGCDTEKLLHEVCHFIVAPKDRRNRMNYGLGPGPTTVAPSASDEEELTVMFLERLLAPIFKLPDDKIAPPDYNVHDRRRLDWEAAEARAAVFFEEIKGTLPT